MINSSVYFHSKGKVVQFRSSEPGCSKALSKVKTIR